MKTFLSVFFSFIFCSSLLAQQSSPPGKLRNVEKLFVVKFKDRKSDIRTPNLIIDHANISDLYLVPNEEAIQHYKVAKGTTVFVATVKPAVQLLTAKQLFSKYKLLDKMKSHPVQIDGYIVREPKNILAEIAAIESVRFNTNGKFIEIKSKLYAKNLQRGLTQKSTL